MDLNGVKRFAEDFVEQDSLREGGDRNSLLYSYSDYTSSNN